MEDLVLPIENLGLVARVDRDNTSNQICFSLLIRLCPSPLFPNCALMWLQRF